MSLRVTVTGGLLTPMPNDSEFDATEGILIVVGTVAKTTLTTSFDLSSVVSENVTGTDPEVGLGSVSVPVGVPGFASDKS